MNNTYEAQFIDQVIKEIQSFENEPIYLTNKVKFNQYDTLKKIVLQQNNGFDTAFSGKRFFFNIGNSRVETVVKKIDLDTKDVELVVDGNYQAESLLLKSEIKQYNKNSKLGKKINEMEREFADCGNVVAKHDESDGIFKRVNLINLKVIDQTAETLEDTTVVEEHKYNATELRREGNERGWERIKDVIETFADEDDPSPDFFVYERYGEMRLDNFKKLKGEEPSEEDDDKYIQTIGIIALDKGKISKRIRTYADDTNNTYGFVLFLEENKGKKTLEGKTVYKPYREAHYGGFQGRWLRKGIREKLFDYQDRANILGNQIYEAMKWSALHILWSSDNKIAGKNIFESLRNGQIIKADSLNILPLEERNLSAHIEEWNKLMELADRECQTFEVATGERLPSGTTLGAIQIQSSSIGEHFDLIREDFGLFLKEVYNDWVLPDIIKSINEEQILELAGDPEYFDAYFEAAANGLLAQNYLKMVALSGGTLSPEQAQEIKQMLKEQLIKQPKKVVEVLKDFYKDISVRCDVIITGESINKQNKVANGIALLGYITNPMIMQDPTARGIVVDIADSLGFNVAKAGIQPPQQPQQQPTQPQVKPVNSPVPEMDKTNKTV